MLYFLKANDVIEKYQVSFNKKEIEDLKRKIIDNCSFVEHKECASDYSPNFTNKFIKNLTITPTGKQKEYFEEKRDINLYSYDEYQPPYLVELINGLLNGNPMAIDKILDYDLSQKSAIEDKISLLNEELNEINPEDITKKKEKFKELEELIKTKKLNENQQSIDLYYEQLISLIKFDVIDSISISELDRIESFLGINLSSRIISNSKEKPLVKSLNK